MKKLTLLVVMLWGCSTSIFAQKIDEASHFSDYSSSHFALISNSACPSTVVNMVNETVDLCASGVVDLTAVELNLITDSDAEALLSWEDNGGNAITFPSNVSLSHSGLSCDPETHTFQLIVDCISDLSLDMMGGTYVVTIYPDISSNYTLPNVDCLVTIADNCVSGVLDIQYSTDGGGSFSNIAPTDLNPGDADIIVDYTVGVAGLPVSCLESGQYTVSCPICPSLIMAAVDDSTDLCGSGVVDLTLAESALMTDWDTEAVLSWEDNGGNVIAFPSNVSLSHSGLSCDPEFHTFQLIVDCTNDLNLDLVGGTYVVTIYPDISSHYTLPSADCLVAIADNCLSGALDIQYSTDGGVSYANVPPASLNVGDADLIVDYTIEVASLPIACLETGQYTVSCLGCPSIILSEVEDSTDLCGSGVVDLTLAESALMTDWDAEVVLSWEDAGGNSIAFPNNVSLSHSGLGCEAELHQFNLIVDCTADANLNLDGGSYVVIIYPDLASGVYLLPSVNCDVAIMDICSSGSVDITYSVDGGINYTNIAPADLSPGDPDLVVDYIISAAGLPNSCEETGQYVVNCPSVCPTTVLSTVNENTGICVSGTIDLTAVEFQLTTDLDAQAVLTWEDEFGNPIAFPNNVSLGHSNTSCDPELITFYLDVSCGLDTSVHLIGGEYTVTIFPDISSAFTVPSTLCEVVISDDCTVGNLDIQYSTDGGGTYSGVAPSNLSPGDPDLVIDFSITVNGAPTGCEETGQYTVSCPGSCPIVILNAASGTEELCGNGNVDLSVIENQLSTDLDIAVVLGWEDGNGNPILDPSNVSVTHSGLSCDPETYTFSLIVDCFTDPNLDLLGGNYEVTVYPDVSTGAYSLPATCLGTIVDNCASGSLNIQYSIDGGISFGSTPPPDLNPGNADWTIHFIVSASGAPAGCEVTGQYTITCPFGCFTTVTNTATGSSDVCESGTVDMTVIESQVITDFDPSVGFIWVDADANGIASPDNMSFTHSGTSCDPETYSFGLVAYCLLDININSFVGTYTITVYPDLSPYYTLPFVDCQVAITDNCTENPLEIMYSTDGGSNFSLLTPPPLQPGDPNQTIHFEVSMAGTGGACPSIGQYTVVCPLGCLNVVLSTVGGSDIVCSGDAVDLTSVENQLITDLDASVVHVWEDALGNEIANPAAHTVLHSGASCQAEVYSFHLYVDCLTDTSLNLFGGMYSVTVYPDISTGQFGLPSDSCQTEITDNCVFGNLNILYSTDGGVNFGSAAPAILNPGDPDLTVDYIVNVPGSPIACAVAGQYVVDCPLICMSSVLSQASGSDEFCEQGIVDLTTVENQLQTDINDANLLFWQDQNGFFVVDPALVNVSHSGTNCDPETYTYHLVVSCVLDNSVSLDGGLYVVTVYPEIAPSLVNIPSTCSTTITDNCSSGSIDIQYSIDGGITYSSTPPPNLNQGDSDLNIDYILSVAGQAAACDVSGEYTVSCPFVCFNTVLNPIIAEAYLCSGDSFDLTTLEGQLMTDAPGTEILFWQDDLGNVIPDPSSVIPTNTTDCFPVQYTYEPIIQCTNNPSVEMSAGSVTLWAFPTDVSAYYTVSGAGSCQTMIDIDVACQSVLTVDADQQTAAIGTNGMHSYQFSYPELGGLDCGLDIALDVPFNCPFICPEDPVASANQLHICSGDTISLLATVTGGNTTNIDYSWTGDNGIGLVSDPALVELFNTDCVPKTYTFTVEATCVDNGTLISPEGNESISITVYPTDLSPFISGFGDGECTTGVNIVAGCENNIMVSPSLSQTGNLGSMGTHDYFIEYNDGGLNLDCAFAINFSLNYNCMVDCPELEVVDPNEPLCSDFGSINLDILVLPTTGAGTWAISSTPPGANPLELSDTELTSNNADVGVYELTYTLDVAPIDFCPDSAVISIEIAPLPVADFDFTVDGNTVTFINNSTDSDNYLWDFDDGASTSSPSPTHTYLEQGVYSVSLIASNGLCSSSTLFLDVTIGNGVGIEEVAVSEVYIYPNPNNGVFYIDLESKEEALFQVLNIEGRVIYSGAINNQREQIDLQNLPAGMYFVEIEMDGERLIKKWIKQ